VRNTAARRRIWQSSWRRLLLDEELPFLMNLSRRFSPDWSGRMVAAAVPWWNGYRRAGGHRLFTANDREPTGIARFVSGVRDSQSDCGTMRNKK
ncbi:MAG: hypothetical protein WBZ15_17140, partial [Mycobacterium sp.]|uniref:hypothetical protein n=1 Tax=Mycobacterium sp. TaxID=1785 RepID=UPI003C4F92C3